MTNRERLCDAGYEEVIILENPDYDNALIGVTEDERAVYAYNKMIMHLVEVDSMSTDDAIEFIDYNTMRVLPYIGAKSPIIIHMLEDL